jgi:predicted ribosomally synthesized peptide with nif11-like leader
MAEEGWGYWRERVVGTGVALRSNPAVCPRILTDIANQAYKQLVNKLPAMSKQNLSALLAKLKEDTWLQDKLKGAADLDAFLAIAKEEGFDVSKADWLDFQADQTPELTDEELEDLGAGIELGLVGGGFFGVFGEEFFFLRVKGDGDDPQA